MNKILVLTLALLIISNFFVLEAAGKVFIKKSDEKRCTNIYKKFLKLGEDEFLKRYPAYPIMDKCMILFKDPHFISKHNPNPVPKESKQTTIQPEVKILSSKIVGTNKALTNFSICYDENKRTNYVLIISDTEKIFGKAQRLPDTLCPSFWIVINSIDISNTQFSWDYGHQSNPKMERKMF